MKLYFESYSSGDFLVRCEIGIYDDELENFSSLGVVGEKVITKEQVIKKFPWSEKMFNSISKEGWENTYSKERYDDSLWSLIVKTAKDSIGDFSTTLKKIKNKYPDIDSYDLSKNYEVETLNPNVFATNVQKLSRFLGNKLMRTNK